jgi:hypothetical protein
MWLKGEITPLRAASTAVRNRRFSVRARMWLNGAITPL